LIIQSLRANASPHPSRCPRHLPRWGRLTDKLPQGAGRYLRYAKFEKERADFRPLFCVFSEFEEILTTILSLNRQKRSFLIKKEKNMKFFAKGLAKCELL
jgi:hypothetical protein